MKYVIHCVYTRGHISQKQSMVARRGLANQANVHTPMWKSLKHSTAEFQSIQQVWLQLDMLSMRTEIKNRRLFLFGLYSYATAPSPEQNNVSALISLWRFWMATSFQRHGRERRSTLRYVDNGGLERRSGGEGKLSKQNSVRGLEQRAAERSTSKSTMDLWRNT